MADTYRSIFASWSLRECAMYDLGGISTNLLLAWLPFRDAVRDSRSAAAEMRAEAMINYAMMSAHRARAIWPELCEPKGAGR